MTQLTNLHQVWMVENGVDMCHQDEVASLVSGS